MKNNTVKFELTKEEAAIISDLLARLASEIDETILDMASEAVGEDDEKFDEFQKMALNAIAKLP